MWRRIIASACIILSIFVFPWWVPLLLACAAAFYFNYFVELIVVGAMIDSFYGSAVAGTHFPYFFALVTAIGYAVISILKKRLIMY